MAHTVYDKGDLILLTENGCEKYGVVLSSNKALVVCDPGGNRDLVFSIEDPSKITVTLLTTKETNGMGFQLRSALNGLIYASNLDLVIPPDEPG